jgi:flavin-dependent dehydrogenase
MQKPIHRIVIVGGGTAGWITAGLIAARHRERPEREIHVVLIESPDIPIIGVGEGTWPSMRMTLQKIGLPEADLLASCDASFKQGTQFIGWADAGTEHRYIHPFSLPAEYSSLNLAGYWLSQASKIPFADFVTPQARVIAAGLAPKQASTPEYAFNVNYGYHFDAGRFAQLLHRHAVDKLGVDYVPANVQAIESAEGGDIAALTLDTGQRVEGDLFVDCTGQRGLLIREHFDVGFVPVKDVLFNDAAIAVQVPYAQPDDPIASTTQATAVANGWIWDIGLQTRRGIGHVYSTAYSDEETAMQTVREYVRRTSPGVDLEALQFRSIPFEPGHRRRLWVRNCVAVGLSGGFIEPLEASALALIEQSASIISQQLPVNREIMDVVAKRFNDRMLYNWERVVEFLKLHYAISARDDSPYWRDNRANASCPEGLREKLALWQQQPPWHDDAPRVDELFPSASYQYVLYGMGFMPEYSYLGRSELERDKPRVNKLLQACDKQARQMTSLLPTNRELLNSMTSLRGVA